MTQGGIVQVAMIALEEKVEQVSPRSVRWNELHKVHQHRCIALIERHEQVIKDIALALTPSAPARLKSEDKKVLEELGVAFCASLSDDFRHKRADAGLVKTAHHLVEQGKESVPETLRRELCMPVLASSVRRGKGVVVMDGGLGACSQSLFCLLNPNLASFCFSQKIVT